MEVEYKLHNSTHFNFRKEPDTLLLDHYSIIGQNEKSLIKDMYPEYSITRVLETFEISHTRDKKDIQNILKKKTEDTSQLEYYESDLNTIKDKFLKYMDKNAHNKFLLLAHTDEGQPVVWEALNRYQSNRNINKYSKELEILENSHIPAVMVTLTYDHDKRSLKEAWQELSKDLHRFRKKLFYEIGKLPYMWVIEAQKNGYPHIHLLLFGKDYIFYNGTYKDYTNRKLGMTTEKSIQSMWGFGFTSVNKTKANKNVKSPIHYVMKYVRKTWNDWTDETILTKSMLWAFNKRSFNVSRDFSEYCYSLDESKRPGEIINTLTLDNAVVITHKNRIPKPKKPDNPDMPLTFYVKKPNKEPDFTTKYECQICFVLLTVREIKEHFKDHRMSYDHSLIRLIRIKT